MQSNLPIYIDNNISYKVVIVKIVLKSTCFVKSQK